MTAARELQKAAEGRDAGPFDPWSRPGANGWRCIRKLIYARDMNNNQNGTGFREFRAATEPYLSHIYIYINSIYMYIYSIF